MSGGSLNYAYQRVEEVADEVASRAETPEHRAFAAHLRKVAKALHDLEWVWSYDYGAGKELNALMACVTTSDVLVEAVERANAAKADLERLLHAAHAGSTSDG